jgi:hypothetical protein
MSLEKANESEGTERRNNKMTKSEFEDLNSPERTKELHKIIHFQEQEERAVEEAALVNQCSEDIIRSAVSSMRCITRQLT